MANEMGTEAKAAASRSSPSSEGSKRLETKEVFRDGHDIERAPSTSSTRNGILYTLWKVLTWSPNRCRWDSANPPKFNMGLNLLFGFAATFTVANLYYNHPILNILAREFNVTDERSSLIPTMMQAGYAAGLLFLCPLGDVFHRRPFVLLLVFFTATVWLGLCLTSSFPVFLALSFITAVSTVTPQLMLPLVGDLAPPHRRATALSIVVSGLLLGMLLARLLSGILTQFTSWRSIYFLSLGLQYAIFILLWLFMPDYPSTNPGGLNYFGMLWSMVTMLWAEPVLAQACIIGFMTSTTFTSFWTTLTFLLAGKPYEYSPITIGLFALIGIAAMAFGPFYSRVMIDRFPPLWSVVLGLAYNFIGLTLGTFIGPFSISGPILTAFLLDLGIQTSQIANRTSIYKIAPKARNRVNTVFMLAVFCGQLTGTAVGNKVYAVGGWRASGGTSMGFIAIGMCVAIARGPWEKGWVGWSGGWGRKMKGGNEEVGEGGESVVTDEERNGERAGDIATVEGAAEDGSSDTLVETKEMGSRDTGTRKSKEEG